MQETLYAIRLGGISMIYVIVISDKNPYDILMEFVSGSKYVFAYPIPREYSKQSILNVVHKNLMKDMYDRYHYKSDDQAWYYAHRQCDIILVLAEAVRFIYFPEQEKIDMYYTGSCGYALGYGSIVEERERQEKEHTRQLLVEVD